MNPYNPSSIPYGSRVISITQATGTALAITGEADDETIALTSQPFSNGNKVLFPSLTGGAGLTAGVTEYYVVSAATNSFKVSATLGGSAINITTDITAGTVSRAPYDVTYIADSFTVERPTTELQRRTELGAPAGFVLIEDFVTGSGEFQLATSSTPIPQNGQTFSATLDAGLGAETFVISSVSQPEGAAELKKVSVNFKKVP